MYYRYSTEEDKTKVYELLLECFGEQAIPNALHFLERRYLLCFTETNKLIAMTGLCEEYTSDYNGKEIDWTCVHPSFRGSGIMTDMFRKLLENETGDIYCSCWRLGDSPEANLHNIMEKFGFHCIERGVKVYNNQHTSSCSECIFNNTKDCRCCEDLYLRRKK